jgi:hypothetical protein
MDYENDQASAARGVLIGFGLSIAFWCVVGVAIWLV